MNQKALSDGVVIFWNQKSQVQVLRVSVVKLSNGHYAEEGMDLFSATKIKDLVQI